MSDHRIAIVNFLQGVIMQIDERERVACEGN